MLREGFAWKIWTGLGVALAAGALFAAAAALAADDEPDFLTIGGGAFDMNDDRTAGQFEFQVRLNNKFWIFKPQLGMFVTTDSAFYAYGGMQQARLSIPGQRSPSQRRALAESVDRWSPP